MLNRGAAASANSRFRVRWAPETRAIVRQLLTEGVVSRLLGACCIRLLPSWTAHMAAACGQPAPWRCREHDGVSVEGNRPGLSRFWPSLATVLVFALAPR